MEKKRGMISCGLIQVQGNHGAWKYRGGHEFDFPFALVFPRLLRIFGAENANPTNAFEEMPRCGDSTLGHLRLLSSTQPHSHTATS